MKNNTSPCFCTNEKHIFRSHKGGKAKSDNHLKPVIFWGEGKVAPLVDCQASVRFQQAAAERVSFAVVNFRRGFD
jgi:hypothetical protein